MFEAIYKSMEAKTKALVSSSRYLSLNVVVIIIVYNQSLLSLHVYLMRDFERVLILLKLE